MINKFSGFSGINFSQLVYLCTFYIGTDNLSMSSAPPTAYFRQTNDIHVYNDETKCK